MHPQHKQCVDRDSSCKLYRNSTAGQQCACHITGQLQMCTVNISFISKCSYGFPKNLCKSPKDHQVVIRGTVDVTKHATTCSACSMEARCPTCTATSAPPKQLHHPRLHAATQHQSTSGCCQHPPFCLLLLLLPPLAAHNPKRQQMHLMAARLCWGHKYMYPCTLTTTSPRQGQQPVMSQRCH